MNDDYAIHSDFLIYLTGKDIDSVYDQQWHQSDKSKTNKNCDVAGHYCKRLYDILQFGLWMTEENDPPFCFNGTSILVPPTPKTCFTELKLSESRKHARQYGRLGIGVKNEAQQDTTNKIQAEIERIKKNRRDRENKVEHGNWPIELDLDACRNM